jgi:SulP family sulfate permease
MTAIDATGLRALEELADRVKESGRRLILCGAREQPAQLMRQSEFEQHVGAENICANVTEALTRAGVVFPQIAAEAPSVQKWGRRSSDQQAAEETAAKSAVHS